MNLTLKESFVTHSRAFSPWTAFYFLQSLLTNFGLGYPFSLLYTAAFTAVLLLLWRILPRVQKALIGTSSLMAACYFPFAQAYGASNFNTLLALYSINMEESTEILTTFPWYSYTAGIFIFVLGVIAIRRKKENEKAHWNTLDSLCLVFSVATFFVALVQNLAWGDVFKLKDTGYPVFRFARDVIVNNNEVIEEQERMTKLSGMKDTWTVTTIKSKYQTYVVMIGESARRDAFSAFGGHWDNTPFANSVNGSIFADYVTASGSTQKSLGSTSNRVVDSKPQFQDNFVTLANRAGFQTWRFSGQGQIGEYNTAIASIAERADEVYFLKEGSFEADKNTRDEALLNMAAQVLAQEHSQPQLIVLHLMGSHPQACGRTQGKYETFVQSKEASCYLYTITQTDDSLRKLYDQLRNSGSSFSLVYFSDHGLTFKGRGKDVQYFAHNDKYQQNFQMPFMVISSDDKAHRVIKAHRSVNDFLGFLSQWTGIKAKEINIKYPFMSEKKAGSIYITNFQLQKVDYSHLGTDIFDPKP